MVTKSGNRIMEAESLRKFSILKNSKVSSEKISCNKFVRARIFSRNLYFLGNTKIIKYGHFAQEWANWVPYRGSQQCPRNRVCALRPECGAKSHPSLLDIVPG